MKRVDCDLKGLLFVLLIKAPIGVEAASHVFAALAIGAAPPVTRKRRRGRKAAPIAGGISAACLLPRDERLCGL